MFSTLLSATPPAVSATPPAHLFSSQFVQASSVSPTPARSKKPAQPVPSRNCIPTSSLTTALTSNPSQEELKQLPPPADPYFAQEQEYGRGAAAAPGSSSQNYLPPAVDRPPAPWAQQPAAAQQQQQPYGAPPAQWGARMPEETVAYDYYGNPIQQQWQQPGGGVVDGGYGPTAGPSAAPYAPGAAAGGVDYPYGGDYASIAAASAAAAAAAAGPSGSGYYEPGAAGAQQPPLLYGDVPPYYGGGAAGDGYGQAGVTGPEGLGGPGGYGVEGPQQQGYGGGRAPRRGPGEYDRVDDWQ